MSESKTNTPLTAEEIATISGGSCTPQDLITISDQLKQTYENLIEFTTYMMERVAGK